MPLQMFAVDQCSIHHYALNLVTKSLASSCRGHSKLADSETELQQGRQKMQMRSNDTMAHRLALMAGIKGSQQGKGSHTHKGRGAREARPCTPCAHALRGRPLPFKTCLEGQLSMGGTAMTGNRLPRARSIAFLNTHNIHNQLIGLVVKVSEGVSWFSV